MAGGQQRFLQVPSLGTLPGNHAGHRGNPTRLPTRAPGAVCQLASPGRGGCPAQQFVQAHRLLCSTP